MKMRESNLRSGTAAAALRCFTATLLLAAAPASAAVFCVDTAAELVQALTDAAGNGVADEIRVVAGTYTPSPEPDYTATVSQDLTISGGWSPTCLGQRPDPTLTTISGTPSHRGMQIYVTNTTANVTIRYLTFRDGNAGAETGGGLRVTGTSGNHLNATLEGCILRSNTASSGGGLEFSSDLGTLRMAGNLIYGNTGTTNMAGVLITANGPSGEVVHNTIATNTITGGGNWGGLRIAGGNPVVFANNIFWGNSGIDLKLANSDTYFLYANDIESQEGTAAGGANNVSVAPQYIGGSNYRLQPTSTLVDAGDAVQATLPAIDLDTGPRELGLGPDLGAYEWGNLFADGFELGSAIVWDATVP
ncbi:MAG: hypothetical protein KDB94_00140 [Acidobacteria bacterium]|nr:hypothetical protein [Acidobacteriota bacterium]